MAEIKLTKNELREQQLQLAQLQKYLPTLQLKKTLLQGMIQEIRQQGSQLQKDLEEQIKKVENFSGLVTASASVHLLQASVKVKQVQQRYENIAGVEIPYFESLTFQPLTYSLFDTDPWIEIAIQEQRRFVELEERVKVSQQQKRILEKEWREVSIRVNLFEKILIPRTIKNIRKIKVFLGDQELASVSRAKVAKKKIERTMEESHA